MYLCSARQEPCPPALEVVPQSAADLFFELIEELELARLAIEVMKS
jgi:hypothetical protein